MANRPGRALSRYGTASEHNQLYNYQLLNAKDIYMGLIQTETPYYQSNPTSLEPFTPNPSFSDPTFADCQTDQCRKAWGLRIVDSSNILVFGAGLYSFFENYGQTCLKTEDCQENMVSVEGTSSSVRLVGLSTKASSNMVSSSSSASIYGANGGAGGQTRLLVPQADNRNNFCSSLALFQTL